MIQSIVYNGTSVQVDVDDPNEHMQRHWAAGTFYEAQRNGVLPFIYKHRDRWPGVWYDVGAAVGNHTLFFAAICHRDVVAIEPSESFDILMRQLKLNKLGTKVTPMHVAVSNEDGRGYMEQVHPDQIGMRELRRYQNEHPRRWAEYEVDIVTLDHIDNKFDRVIGMVKIDVEHHEIEVLQGAVGLLERWKPAVFVECATEEELVRVNTFMVDRGYFIQGDRSVANNFTTYKFNPTPTYLWEPKP